MGYAIYLWGLARGDARVRDLGRLMTSLEIRAAWSYWQMTNGESNFPAPFSNNKVTRDDLKCPEDAVGEEIRNAIDKETDILVTCLSACGEECVIATKVNTAVDK